MSISQFVIEETSLTKAWCDTLERIVKSPGNEISPLLLTLTNFDESQKARKLLDSHLDGSGYDSIKTVSETIFPYSLYELCKQDRFALYDEYNNNIRRIKKIHPSNGRGTYFERLIAYEGTKEKINQIEIIISSFIDRKIKRRSKFQASIFDPNKDHTNRPYQSFPCLQHVTFYQSENGGLVLNSFYAIQYLYRRAYGNWLGLINLGKFIANETNMPFERFNCYIGVEHLDDLKKGPGEMLLKKMNSAL